jgi:hypothetical protein
MPGFGASESASPRSARKNQRSEGARNSVWAVPDLEKRASPKHSKWAQALVCKRRETHRSRVDRPSAPWEAMRSSAVRTPSSETKLRRSPQLTTDLLKPYSQLSFSPRSRQSSALPESEVRESPTRLRRVSSGITDAIGHRNYLPVPRLGKAQLS